MADISLDPYQILGVAHTATSKEILLAYTKASASGKHDKATLAEAMSSLTNEARRAEVDVLAVGEAPADLTKEHGPVDPNTLLSMLAADLPAVDLSAFIPWQDLLPIPAALEPCAVEIDLVDSSKENTTDAEPSIDFPI